MIIRVHYSDLANQKIEEQVTLPDEATVRDLLHQMGDSFSKKMVVMNGQVMPMNSLLKENAEVYLFNPMAGG